MTEKVKAECYCTLNDVCGWHDNGVILPKNKHAEHDVVEKRTDKGTLYRIECNTCNSILWERDDDGEVWL